MWREEKMSFNDLLFFLAVGSWKDWFQIDSATLLVAKPLHVIHIKLNEFAVICIDISDQIKSIANSNIRTHYLLRPSPPRTPWQDMARVCSLNFNVGGQEAHFQKAYLFDSFSSISWKNALMLSISYEDWLIRFTGDDNRSSIAYFQGTFAALGWGIRGNMRTLLGWCTTQLESSSIYAILLPRNLLLFYQSLICFDGFIYAIELDKIWCPQRQKLLLQKSA